MENKLKLNKRNWRDLENTEALQSHPYYLLEDLGTCSATRAQCIKEIRSLEIYSSCLTFRGWCVPHNQIFPVRLEEAVAHLCRCSKAAKNSPEGDGGKRGLRVRMSVSRGARDI